MVRKSFDLALQVRSVDEDQRVIEGIASTPSVDRMGDVVEPLGAQFKLPLPLLHQHNHAAPIGQVVWAKATKDGIRFRAQLAKVMQPGPLKDRVDTAWLEIKSGLTATVSIGFRALEYARLDTGGIRFVSWEWFELSVVTIPAQADAEILVARAASAGRRGHVVKLGRPADHVVKLSPADLHWGRAIAASNKRTAGSPIPVVRLPASFLTPEQLHARAWRDANQARIERAREELEAREWRRLSDRTPNA